MRGRSARMAIKRSRNGKPNLSNRKPKGTCVLWMLRGGVLQARIYPPRWTRQSGSPRELQETSHHKSREDSSKKTRSHNNRAACSVAWRKPAIRGWYVVVNGLCITSWTQEQPGTSPQRQVLYTPTELKPATSTMAGDPTNSRVEV